MRVTIRFDDGVVVDDRLSSNFDNVVKNGGWIVALIRRIGSGQTWVKYDLVDEGTDKDRLRDAQLMIQIADAAADYKNKTNAYGVGYNSETYSAKDKLFALLDGWEI